jgi:hypothetical protein
LAAYRISRPIAEFKDVGRSLHLSSDLSQMKPYVSLLKQTKLFSFVPDWQLLASLVESSLFVPLLRARRLDVFARDDNSRIGKDHYLNLIPVTWVGCNNLLKAYVPTDFLFDMMVISLLGYQTDEFFEAVVAPAFSHDPASLQSIISYVLRTTLDDECQNSANCLPLNVPDASLERHKVCTTHPCISLSYPADSMQVCQSFSRLARNVLYHDRVRKASGVDRKNLEFEFKNFLLAHARQMMDNNSFASQVEEKVCIYKNSLHTGSQ